MQLKKIVKNVLPDHMVDFIVAMQIYKKRHGVFPSLRDPQTLNEKIVHRKLRDRRDFLPIIADKYAVRDFVGQRIGVQYLPALYHVTGDPDSIPFDTLPDKFVVKPNHGSGWVRIIHDKSALDRQELIETCKSWLAISYYEWTREWAYKHIEPQILVEEYVHDEGKTPNDYKMYVFDGRVEFLHVDIDRYGDHRRDFYTRDWKKLDVTFGYENIPGGAKPPPHFEEMLRVVDQLCEGIDFVRADFYDTKKQVYFGELTGTPGNGLERFFPNEFDHILGKHWKLHKPS